MVAAVFIKIGQVFFCKDIIFDKFLTNSVVVGISGSLISGESRADRWSENEENFLRQ